MRYNENDKDENNIITGNKIRHNYFIKLLSKNFDGCMSFKKYYQSIQVKIFIQN